MATDDEMSDDVAVEEEDNGTPEKKSRRKRRSGKRNRTTPAIFVRQVVAELRKVIWPTRSELITYTTVSLVFVLALVGIVFGIDQGLQWGVFHMFS
jgi:preprotein translocase subunit SecE